MAVAPCHLKNPSRARGQDKGITGKSEISSLTKIFIRKANRKEMRLWPETWGVHLRLDWVRYVRIISAVPSVGHKLIDLWPLLYSLEGHHQLVSGTYHNVSAV